MEKRSTKFDKTPNRMLNNIIGEWGITADSDDCKSMYYQNSICESGWEWTRQWTRDLGGGGGDCIMMMQHFTLLSLLIIAGCCKAMVQ